MTVFQASFPSEKKYAPAGVAYGPKDSELFLVPASGTPVTHWKPLELVLRDGGFADYLANNKGIRLCSEKLCSVIESVRSERDAVQWLDVSVTDGREVRPYYVLHFPVDYPVVDVNKSIMAGPAVVRPSLRRSEAEGHDIFTLPSDYGCMFVSSKMKNAIQKAKCTGLAFEMARVSE